MPERHDLDRTSSAEGVDPVSDKLLTVAGALAVDAADNWNDAEFIVWNPAGWLGCLGSGKGDGFAGEFNDAAFTGRAGMPPVVNMTGGCGRACMILSNIWRWVELLCSTRWFSAALLWIAWLLACTDFSSMTMVLLI